MFTIAGLDELEREIADQLWACNTQDHVDAYIANLPPSLQVRAKSVFQLMCIEAMDAGSDPDNVDLACQALKKMM